MRSPWMKGPSRLNVEVRSHRTLRTRIALDHLPLVGKLWLL